MRYRAFKILVLHGHGQSADIIKPKTRFIRQLLQSLSQGIEFEFEFLSALHAAYPDADASNDQRVWGIGEPQTDRIQGLENSIAFILETLECSEQEFCGIIGFSSGAAMAAIVTSLLEKRKPICGIPYQTRHPPLLFAICLSGFMLENSHYADLYTPKISTPIFHTIGIWDGTVSAAQTTKLARHCVYPRLFHFEGGHYVPQAKEVEALKAPLLEFLQDVPEIAFRIALLKNFGDPRN